MQEKPRVCDSECDKIFIPCLKHHISQHLKMPNYLCNHSDLL